MVSLTTEELDKISNDLAGRVQNKMKGRPSYVFVGIKIGFKAAIKFARQGFVSQEEYDKNTQEWKNIVALGEKRFSKLLDHLEGRDKLVPMSEVQKLLHALSYYGTPTSFAAKTIADFKSWQEAQK